MSLAVLLGAGLASAVPNPNYGEGSSCYKCEYKQDDCGKEYGGYLTLSHFSIPCCLYHSQLLTFLQLL